MKRQMLAAACPFAGASNSDRLETILNGQKITPLSPLKCALGMGVCLIFSLFFWIC